MKPIVTKLKYIHLLEEIVIFGNMYHNAVKPFIEGELSIPNRNNIKMVYNDQEYVIRVNIAATLQPTRNNEEFMEYFREEVKDFRYNFRTKVGQMYHAGVGLFKDITDCNDLNTALNTMNTFEKDGVTVTNRKVARGEETVTEFELKANFGNYHLTTTDPEEVMVFLGSLAVNFTKMMQQPDPSWFRGMMANKEMPF